MTGLGVSRAAPSARIVAAVHRPQPLREQHQLALAEALAVDSQLLDNLDGCGVERRDGGRLGEGVDDAEGESVGGGEDFVGEEEAAGGAEVDDAAPARRPAE